MSVYLMSYPRHDWGIKGGSNFKSRESSTGINPRGAMTDWLLIADAIHNAGGDVLVLPPAMDRNLTGLPYTAESGMVGTDADGARAFILPNMTPPHRKDEALHIGGFVAALGWRQVTLKARWEAQGDAIRLDDARTVHTYGVGEMARTERASYEEVADLLGPQHIQIGFSARPWFHGNTFLATFTSTTGQPHLMVCPDALLPGELERLKAFTPDVPMFTIAPTASTGYATNALQVGDTVIAPSNQPTWVLEFWDGLGLSVVALELPQLFHRGGGAAVCLTNRLDGVEASTLPDHLLYKSQRATLYALRDSYPDA